MTNTFNDTSANEQGLVQHLRFITGLDSLGINDIVRLFNFALDDYGYLALTSSGRWKFDDSTHRNSDGERTLPIASATLNAEETSIPLSSNFMSIEKVTLDGNILIPIDNRDYQSRTPSQVFGSNGTPTHFDYDAHNLFFYPNGSGGTVKILYSRLSPYFEVTDEAVEVGIPRHHHLYLVLHAARQLGFKTIDSNRTDIKEELQKWEGVNGFGGKIRDWYFRRDQTTGRKMRAKIHVPK